MVQVRIFDRLAFLSAFVAMLVKHKPAIELPFRVRVDALATIGLPWHVQDVSTNNFVEFVAFATSRSVWVSPKHDAGLFIAAQV